MIQSQCCLTLLAESITAVVGGSPSGRGPWPSAPSGWTGLDLEMSETNHTCSRVADRIIRRLVTQLHLNAVKREPGRPKCFQFSFVSDTRFLPFLILPRERVAVLCPHFTRSGPGCRPALSPPLTILTAAAPSLQTSGMWASAGRPPLGRLAGGSFNPQKNYGPRIRRPAARSGPVMGSQ